MVEQPGRNPEQSIKETLADFKKRMAQMFASSKEDKTAVHYLEAKEAPDPRVTRPPEREAIKEDLKKLTKVIAEQATTPEDKAKFVKQLRMTVTTTAARIVAESPNASTQEFYNNVQAVTGGADESHILPIARFIARSAESASTGPEEGARKVRLALEVFAGEQELDSRSFELLKRIVISAREAYGLPEDFVNKELERLLSSYNRLRGRQATEIMRAAMETVEGTSIKTEEEIRDDLRQNKEAMLGLVDSPGLKAKIDLMLLSLPPYKMRQLLGTVPENLKYEHSRGLMGLDPTELRADLERPENQGGIDTLINEWMEKFKATLDADELAVFNGLNLTGSVRQHILGMRNEYFVTFMRNFAPSLYQSGDQFRNWMNRMSKEFNPNKPHHPDDLAITVLAMQSQNDFLFSEYYKGKMAELITDPHHEQMFKDFITRAKDPNKPAFALSSHEFFHYVMREVNQANLFKIGGDFHGQAYDIIDSIIKNMKTLPNIKAQTVIGGVAVNVRYTQKRESMDMGFEFTQSETRSEGSLAYATATYMSHAKEIQEVSAHVGEFVKQVEKGGKPEELVSAAGKIDNKTMDVIGEIPIAKLAAQAYIRLIRDRIQFNNGQLPPDMFSNRDYIKNVLDKELEYHVKSIYDPDMTDSEKDTYLKLGKALAFTSGEFQDILSDALPPMTALVDWSKCPKEVRLKLERGENLTMAEMRSLHLSVKPEYRDFPFRSLLITMNPLKWLFAWIKSDDYGLFQSGFIPHQAGKGAMDWAEAMDASDAVMRSVFFGLDEEAVQYFDGKHAVPVLKLSDYTHNISLEKRGGVRAITIDIVRKHIQEVHIPGSLNGIDGVKTMDKLMAYSPMLAYRFLNSPPNAPHIEVQWTAPGADGRPRIITDAKEIAQIKAQQLDKLFTYMHEYYPTFFIGIEKNHFFRRSELSFVQNIRESVLTNLDANTATQSGYWRMLNNEEQSGDGRLMKEHDATMFGANNEHRLMVSKDIAERMTSILREAELYLQEERFKNPSGSHTKLSEFFRSDNPAEFDQKLYKRLIDNIIKQRKGWHDLNAGAEEIFQLVRQFANDVFYKSDSIYSSKRYLGNNQLSRDLGKQLQEKGYAGLSASERAKVDGERMHLSAYYQKLLGQGLLSNPFNWAYLSQSEFNFQGTGIGMVGRNMGDLKPILESNSYYMNINGKINDAISQPGKAAETIEGAFDDLGNKLNEVKNSHGGALSAEMGWLMAAYVMYPFTSSRARDIPGAGSLVARTINSWASHMNKKDRFKSLVFDSRVRKKIMDKWLQFPMSKSLFSPHQDNIQVETGLKNEVEIDIPLFGKINIPLSGTMRKMFGSKTKPVFSEDQVQYTVDAFKDFAKIENWWVGGENNFGIGYNTLLSVFMIGAVMLFIQSFKEGLKAAESKA